MKCALSLLLFLTVACSIRAGEPQKLPPFTIIPFADLKDATSPGRDYYLARHNLRIQLTVKVSSVSILDETADPEVAPPAHNPHPSFYKAVIKAEPTGATLVSVRQKDPSYRYFMSFGQVKSFFRDKKFDSSFSEDGFLLGSTSAFEDKTLQIAAGVAKVALVAMADKGAEDPAKISADQREKARDARRLKEYTAKLKNAIKAAQEQLAAQLASAPPDLGKAGQISEALALLRTELEAAQAQRTSLLKIGAKSEVVIFTVDLNPETFNGSGISKGQLEKPIILTLTPEWGEFKQRLEQLIDPEAPNVVGALLDSTHLQLDFQDQQLATLAASVPPAGDLFPFQGIIYRRPLLASGLIKIDGNTLGQTEGTTLKFGQFGAIIALPVKAYAFAKGDMAIAFTSDGEILKMAAGNTASGSIMNAAATSALADYQSYRKTEASGGLETELLNAETARMKARVDHHDMTTKYNALEATP